MSTALRVDPLPRDWSDAELVAAVRRGSDAAFAELYSRYSQRIGAFVHGMVRDHGRAEDITQDIFISALRRIRETERPIAFKAWIYEIAKNACIDNFRRSRRAEEVSLDADDSLSSADRGRLTAITTLDAALDNKQTLNDLRGAFGGLSENHHEILVLRELEGRSYSDIGERLGMSRPVVESTLFRARRRLAEEYEELSSGRRCEFVRKMVDSGPHYSLGIRDRRRMARHFAHCQACRSHARQAGFDESILNMPDVAVRVAALSPVLLLRAGWGAIGHVLGLGRERQSLLALRSMHALVRSSDQIFGAGTGAGRGAATCAAIVLAGMGSGIATVASSQPAKRLHLSAARATLNDARARVLIPTNGEGQRPKHSVGRREASVAAARVVSSGTVVARSGASASRRSGVAPSGASLATAAAGPPTTVTAAGSGAPASTGGVAQPAGSGAGGPAKSGASAAGDPTTPGTGGSLPGTLQPVVRSLPTSALSLRTVSATLGGVTAAVSRLGRL